ncbi:hypothetical protein TWF696_008883 [Orbilia brochopaga]|uniref:Uncharacterized protein n=1 Tax=Orbilia brochopaga TaxID=3140254 RepID=A0AAV9UHK4_9PEZI
MSQLPSSSGCIPPAFPATAMSLAPVHIFTGEPGSCARAFLHEVAAASLLYHAVAQTDGIIPDIITRHYGTISSKGIMDDTWKRMFHQHLSPRVKREFWEKLESGATELDIEKAFLAKYKDKRPLSDTWLPNRLGNITQQRPDGTKKPLAEFLRYCDLVEADLPESYHALFYGFVLAELQDQRDLVRQWWQEEKDEAKLNWETLKHFILTANLTGTKGLEPEMEEYLFGASG